MPRAGEDHWHPACERVSSLGLAARPHCRGAFRQPGRPGRRGRPSGSRRRRAERARGPQPSFAAFGQCVGAADVARPPMDFRPPEVGAGDGGKGLDGTTGGLEKLPA